MDRFLGRVGAVRSIGNDGLCRVVVDGMEGAWVQALIESAASVAAFTVGCRVHTRHVSVDEGRRLMAQAKLRWDDDFPELLGTAGVVVHKDKDGDLRVEVGRTIANWAAALLDLAPMSMFSVGDRVRIKQMGAADAQRLMANTRVTWQDSMTPLLGAAGVVMEVDSDGDFRVLSGRTRCAWPSNMLEAYVGGKGLSPRMPIKGEALGLGQWQGQGERQGEGQVEAARSAGEAIRLFEETGGLDALQTGDAAPAAALIAQLERLDPAAFRAAVQNTSQLKYDFLSR